MKKGFTLVELLLVIALIGTVGLTMFSVVVSTLRGSNKSTFENEIRQEGNAVIIKFSRQIKGAQSFEAATTQNIPNPSYTPNVCDSAETGYRSIEIKNTAGKIVVIGCPDNSSGDNTNSFTTIDPSLINVSSCKLYCSRNDPTDPPTIEMDFTLSQLAGQTIEERKGSQNFSASVKIRNPAP